MCGIVHHLADSMLIVIALIPRVLRWISARTTTTAARVDYSCLAGVCTLIRKGGLSKGGLSTKHVFLQQLTPLTLSMCKDIIRPVRRSTFASVYIRNGSTSRVGPGCYLTSCAVAVFSPFRQSLRVCHPALLAITCIQPLVIMSVFNPKTHLKGRDVLRTARGWEFQSFHACLPGDLCPVHQVTSALPPSRVFYLCTCCTKKQRTTVMAASGGNELVMGERSRTN